MPNSKQMGRELRIDQHFCLQDNHIYIYADDINLRIYVFT